MYPNYTFRKSVLAAAVAVAIVPSRSATPMTPSDGQSLWTVAGGPPEGPSRAPLLTTWGAQAGDSSSLRLTVRPRTMVTATQTTMAGRHLVPGLSNSFVYVPASAVGKHRVPLVVVLHAAGGYGGVLLQRLQPLADKYGFIVLAPSSTRAGRWDFVQWVQQGEQTASGIRVPSLTSLDIPKIDFAMRYVLQNYAVDPSRIALVGFSDGGSTSLLLGRANLDIFSRIVGLSAMIPYDGNGPANPATQFLLTGGIEEGLIPQTLKLAQVLRHAGNPVSAMLALRGHTESRAEDDFAWHWLAQSWEDSTVTGRTNAGAVASADSGPILTHDAITRMTAFWTRFVEQPDYISRDGREAHQAPRWFTVGTEPVATLMTDMVAMAATYPSVAADLKAAGLTAEQEDAYRLAMFEALCARAAEKGAGSMALGRDIPFNPIKPNSVTSKNLAVLHANASDFSALKETGIWTMP